MEKLKENYSNQKIKDKKNEDKEEESHVSGSEAGGGYPVVADFNPFRGRAITRSPPATCVPSKIDEIVVDREQIEGQHGVTATQPDASAECTSNAKVAVDEDNFWQDEETGTSPIYKLYGARGNEKGSPWKEESPIKKKRKREVLEEGNGMDTFKEMNAMVKALSGVTKKMEDLTKQISGSRKTKLEIRSTANELAHMIGILNKKVDVLKRCQPARATQVLGVHASASKTAQVGEKTAVGKDALRVSKGIAIQADGDEIDREISLLNRRVSNEIEELIQGKAGWTGLSQVIDLEWQVDSFKNTNATYKGSVKELKGNIAFIIDPALLMTANDMKKEISCFAELEPLMGEKLEEGSIEYVRTNTQTLTSKAKKEKESSRSLYLLPYKMELDGVHDIHELYNLLEEWDKVMATHGVEEISIVALGNLDANYLRKCIEFIVRGTSRRVEIIERKVGRKVRHEKQREKPVQQTEKVIVAAEGKGYAEVLRAIKTNVNIDQLGVGVKAIRKTAQGDIMLELKGGKDKAESFKQAIQTANVATRVKIQNNEEIVHISGIEGDIEKDEVIEAIKISAGITAAEDIKLLSIRPGWSGRQNAMVALRKGPARDLIKRGSVKIGWTLCGVRARVNVVRCYKCLEFGHRSSDCEGTDKSGICLNCGEDNHRAKDCKNASFCLTCKVVGHRAEQTRCPHFRQLISGMTKAGPGQNGGRRASLATSGTRPKL